MKETNHITDSHEVLNDLHNAFESFTTASTQVQHYYTTLQKEVVQLRKETEDTNQKLEKNLLEKEEAQTFLKAILEGLTIGILVIDKRDTITCANNAAVRFAQIPIDGNGHTLLSSLARLYRLDGHNLAEGSTAQALSTEITVSPQGSEERILKIRCITPTDLTGRITIKKIVTIEDTTELHKLEKSASLNSRLAGMGEIAVNVAHEVRNPLGSIELISSLLHKELGDRPEEQNLVEHITTGVRAIDATVSNILLFTRKQEITSTPLNLAGVIYDSLTYVEMTLRQKNMIYEEGFTWNEPMIDGDSELLKQVFLNLILNAIQAMDTGGRLKIIGYESEKSIIVKVIDNGSGIREEDLDRIFDPFFTTKRKGTGLGLTIAYKIIQAHHGTLEVKSQEGKGTQFILTLPQGTMKDEDQDE